ncbi:MAG: hypothetical protein ACRCXZ_02405 [Patescibacteria group bacterium]
MFKESKFKDIFLDEETYLMSYREGIEFPIDFGSYLSPRPMNGETDQYPVLYWNEVEQTTFYLDPKEIALLESIQDIELESLLNSTKFNNLFDLFNSNSSEFEQILLNYFSTKNIFADRACSSLELVEDQILLCIHSFCYLWTPIQDGQRVKEKNANYQFNRLSYSATFSKVAIGNCLIAKEEEFYILDEINFFPDKRPNSVHPCYRAEEFVHLFKEFKDTKDTFYIFERSMNIVYIVRVEPNFYLQSPYQEPGIISAFKRFLFGQ